MTWSIVQADCIDFLRAQPEASLDLVFGSPPYEQARLYLEEGQDLGIARDTQEWVAWMVEVTRAAIRACKGLVAWVVEGQTRDFRYSCSPELLRADLCRAGFNLRKSPIYHRVGIPGSGGPDWLRNDYESIVCVTRPGKLSWSDNTACGHVPKWGPGGEMSHRVSDGTRVNQWGGHPLSSSTRTRSGTRQKPGRPSHVFTARNGDSELCDGRENQLYTPPVIANPGNVIFTESSNLIRLVVGGGHMGKGDRFSRLNEAPFPEDLAAFFVLSFCPPGGFVADCFSGSGTTASVAKQHGRNFTGCDLRQSQVDLALRRLAGVTPSLFAEEEEA